MTNPTTDYSQSLKNHSLKVTPARLTLMTILGKKAGPMTALDIAAHPDLADYNTATVYRILENLCQVGLVDRIGTLKDRSAYYEISAEDHHHLICHSCGLIEEIPGCQLQPLSDQVQQQSQKFAAITGHRLEFYGLCYKCQTPDR